ncbi:hypothetical protein ABET52_04430, partial [Saccharococcus caldoxylosilyticus]
MSVYTHDDIKNAVDVLEAEGLGEFLYQEPTGRRHRTHGTSRSRGTGRITGRPGRITGQTGRITGQTGRITGRPGRITGQTGRITGRTDRTT